MTSRWNLKINVSETKKSAKDALFEIGKTILKAAGAPEQIDFKVYHYNIVNKLAEEVNKLTEEKAREILETLKKELEQY
jgi:actin-like ATPase involved in cell morphogenesis